MVSMTAFQAVGESSNLLRRSIYGDVVELIYTADSKSAAAKHESLNLSIATSMLP